MTEKAEPLPSKRGKGLFLFLSYFFLPLRSGGRTKVGGNEMITPPSSPSPLKGEGIKREQMSDGEIVNTHYVCVLRMGAYCLNIYS